MVIGGDKSKIKIFSLAVLSVLFSGFFGYAVKSAVLQPEREFFLISVLAVSLWMLVKVISVLAIKKVSHASLIAFLETLSVWYFLVEKFSAHVLLGMLFLFVCFVAAQIKGQAILKNSLRINFFHISQRFLAIAMTGVALFITLYALQSLDFNQPSVPRNFFDLALKSSEPIVQKFIPDFSLTSPLNDFLKALAKKNLPPGTSLSQLNQAVSELKSNITRNTKIVVTGQEKVIDIFYQITVSELAVLTPALKISAVIGIGVLMFFLIKSLAFFLNWIIIGLAFLAYHLLLASEFLKIASESRDQQVIVI